MLDIFFLQDIYLKIEVGNFQGGRFAFVQIAWHRSWDPSLMAGYIADTVCSSWQSDSEVGNPPPISLHHISAIHIPLFDFFRGLSKIGGYSSFVGVFSRMLFFQVL